jgi:hypothetical protein
MTGWFKFPKCSNVGRRSNGAGCHAFAAEKSWLRPLGTPSRKHATRSRRCIPIRLEALEDRLAPAVFNVTSLADGGPGSGSLRAAILQSNSTPGPNTINLMTAGPYQLSLFGSSHIGVFGALQITSQSVTITNASGGPVNIDGGGVDRVFDIEGNISGGVTFTGLTITGGLAGSLSNAGNDTNGAPGDGGAIYSPQTNVTLNNCQVIDNLAFAAAGAIFTDTGNVTLNGSTVSGNNTEFFVGSGGGGGGIFSLAGNVSLTNSSVTGNVSFGEGGGIYIGHGSLSVTGSNISGNSAFNDGGGIAMDAASTGNLTVSSSTITDNVAGFPSSIGGGIWQASVTGTTSVTNSTVSGNLASTGGGIFTQSQTVTISGSTINGNSGGGISATLGSGSTMTVNNSTIDGNLSSATSSGSSAGGLSVTCTTLNVFNSSIDNNRNAGQGPLTGGGVQASITAGTFTNVNVIGNHSGFVGGLTFQNFTTLSMTDCNISDNSTGAEAGGIFVVGGTATGTGTFTNCTINGNHSGAGFGGMEFHGSSLTMTSCTISNNTTVGDSAGLFVDTAAGSLTNCTVSNNSTAGSGGGIEIENIRSSTGLFTITNCTISGNRSGFDGGGVFDSSNGTEEIDFNRDTVSGNTAANAGGGIAFERSGTGLDALQTVTISGNSAAVGGGAFVLPNAPTPFVFGSIIAGNHATPSAGPDVDGAFSDSADNLIGVEDASCSSFTNGKLFDQVGTAASPINPLLGPLENNGGPTFTMILRPGSSAIAASSGSGTDQRGFARPGAGQSAASIGALETQLPSFLGTSANGAYVENLFETLLGRTADPGAAGFVTMLNNGVSRATVVSDLVHSTEYLTDEVRQLYFTYLHRAADPGGLQHFVGVLTSGGTVEQVDEVLVSSGEYFQLHGSENDAFLTALYYDALGRGGSPAEQAGFLQGLNGGSMSRAQVAAAIFGSAEYRNDLVEYYYQEFLGRNVDPGSLVAWQAQLKAGMSDAQLVAALLGSGEAFAKRS